MNDGTADEITTTVTLGRYAPAKALQLMLRNTPFKSEVIKGGFSITSTPASR